jgi:Protein of unknown function (DUF3551)
MRIPVFGILTIVFVLAAAPVRAQTYDPNYPVCLQTYALGGGNIDCSFTSLALCALSASGRSAQCLNNPYFANAKMPAGPNYRQRRGAY